MDSEAHLRQDSILDQERDPALAQSTSNHVVVQTPVKKPTRQWAAWTHQEEQNFFAALRQVGKNFEKITHRVQSKNKDQVRHYYYRLVRRMNKLLGPELSLDSKNSKDANAAMLRWWALLEKYSCKASKLHLKPRRFKIFMEALEHQLLKDRKKTVRKRPSQGENCPPDVHSTPPNQSPSEPDRTVKLVLVDNHNIQKSGPGRGASLKRSGSIGINRGNKGDSITMKPPRQRRKPGVVPSTAAYKKWEKAAIAGVSLVADAAEHLEKAIEKEVGQDKSSAESAVPVGHVLPHTPISAQNVYAENSIHISMKLKLQLFPIDESTRRALEMDKLNPHLELTLPTRKKISSVMEHLTRKWGNSSVATGELMLFPNSIQQDTAVGYLRWTQDSNVSAGDVYSMIGRPPVFRLRYGWFPSTELGFVSSQISVAPCMLLGEQDVDKMKEPVMESTPNSPPSAANQCGDLHNDLFTSVTDNHSLARTLDGEPNQKTNLVGDPTKSTSWHEKVVGDQGILRHQGEVDGMRLHDGAAVSAKEWADSLTNISVEDLLTGVTTDIDANCVDQSLTGRSQCLSQIPFSCDSFDAAIAAHISRQKNKMGCETPLVSHVSSIWDAEETCDAFVFQNNLVFHQSPASSSGIALPGDCKQISSTSSAGCGHTEEVLTVVDPQGDPMEQCQGDADVQGSSVKDFNSLADIYWPESLGPLDLDQPSTKYHIEDLILNDSLSGLNRLIASSLDAFQNCSFFGSNKKEPTPSVEARETISFQDLEIKNGF